MSPIREIEELKQQLSACRDELVACQSQLIQVSIENMQMRSDFCTTTEGQLRQEFERTRTVMGEEIERLKSSLEAALAEREAWRHTAQQASAHVNRLEDDLHVVTTERDCMLTGGDGFVIQDLHLRINKLTQGRDQMLHKIGELREVLGKYESKYAIH